MIMDKCTVDTVVPVGSFDGTPAELLDLCGQILDTGAEYLIMYVMEAVKLDRLNDLMNALQVFPNVIGLIGLSGAAAAYAWNKRR